MTLRKAAPGGLNQIDYPAIEQKAAKHVSLAAALREKGDAVGAANDYREAVRLYEQVHAHRQSNLGPEHADTHRIMLSLATAYREVGRFDEAIQLFELLGQLREQQLGPRHRDTLSALNNLGITLARAGRSAQSIEVYRRVVEERRASLGPDHPETLHSMNNLAFEYYRSEQWQRAIPLYEETFQRRTAVLGAEHSATLLTQRNLGRTYRVAGQADKAVLILEVTRGKSMDYATRRWVLHELAIALIQTGQPAKATPVIEERLVHARSTLADGSPLLADELITVGLDFVTVREWEKAESVLHECLAIRERRTPDSWPTSNAKTALGQALLGQKQYSEAEPLLVSGYAEIKLRSSNDPERKRLRLPVVLRSLIELYTALGNHQEVEKWRQEYKAIPPASGPSASERAAPESP